MEVIKETLWKRCLCTPTKPPAKNSNICLSDDSVPAQRNKEEVQENNSSRHNSVTASDSNVQTTSYRKFRKPWPKSKTSEKKKQQAKTSDISKQSPSPLHLTFLLGRARFTAQPTPNLYPPCSYLEFARYCACWLDVLTAGQGERRCSPKRLI